MTAVLRYVLRKFYLLSAITLIGLAVLVQAGRSFSPLVGDYRAELASYMGAQLNAQVSLGAVKAEWEGLKPVLEVVDLSITNHSDEPLLAFGEARLRLDLLRSLWNWRLVWGGVTLQETALEFEQTSEGFWRIPGLPQASQTTPDAVQLDVLVDMLLLANKIEFQRSRLVFRFAEGHQVVLDSPSLLMENRGSFHRLSLAVDIEARKQAVVLVIEGVGDPRVQTKFRAKGFLALNDFPTSEPLAAASALLLGDITPTELRSEGALNARLWFSTRAGNDGFDIQGQLDLQTLLLPVFAQQYQLDSFSTGINGYWLRSGSWRLELPGINAGLQEARIENVNLAVAASGYQAPLQIHLDQLQLATWIDVLDQAGIPGEGALREVIDTMSPTGALNNLLITLPLDKPTDWQLEANAQQVAVKAWKGVPALSGVDGYIRAGQKGGFINLDSRQGFSMHFDPTYAKAMHYQAVSGQVAWHLQPGNNQIYVNSGALQLRNEREEATGFLWLSLPWQRNSGDIDLYLHIGARNLDAALYDKYLPSVVPESLSNWLQQSIGDNNSGSVSEGGFVYRGTLNTPNHMARSHQLYLDIDNAELAYHPDWPGLRQLRGRLLVSDNNVDASVDAGRLYDSEVLRARIATRPNPEGEGALLNVSGQVSGLASDGLRILRESHLRQYIANSMDSWKLSGGMTTDINLSVPLAPGAGGAAQQIDIALEAPSFELENFRLSLRDIKGRVSYNHLTGLDSEGLQGVLFDEAVSVQLASQKRADEDPKTLIKLVGAVASDTLAEWSQRPELHFLQGTLPYTTQIELIHRRRKPDVQVQDREAATNRLMARIKVASDLDGVVVNLPAPYGKPAKGERPLAVNLEIREQTRSVGIEYRADEALLAQAQFLLQGEDDNKLLNANIALGQQARLAAEPQFLLSGKLPALVVEDWQSVVERYQAARRLYNTDAEIEVLAPETLAVSGLIADLPLRVEMTLGAHKLGPLMLKDVSLKAWQQDQVWHLEFDNPMLTGALQRPVDKTLPMTIAVQDLHLSRGLLGDKEAEVAPPELDLAASLTEEAEQFDPRSLPLADVRVEALYVDGSNYGNWSLKVRPDDKGVLFDDIRGNIRGLTVSGIQPRQKDSDSAGQAINQEGAKIYWLVDSRGMRTRFIGSLAAGDMTEVLLAWQKPDMIESSSASFQVDLTWPGAPGEFALKNLQGNLDLFLQDGRFKRTSGAGEGILRLFALVNFDSLARRLRLDFSDLYKSGLSYDQVQGSMEFDEGKIFFTEPLQVQSPSSRLQMAGSINLQDETIDTRLIAALPVAGNLTFLAAFATGLPAAAGIYLVSKIFRKQVDQATSVSYSIKGSWDDPDMKFDRLFESEASLRSSVNDREVEEAFNPDASNPETPNSEASTPESLAVPDASEAPQAPGITPLPEVQTDRE